MTPAQLRKLVLALDDTEESAHMGHPDFRVSGKIFAGLTPDEKHATINLPLELQAAVVDDQPEAFEPSAGSWGKRGWTKVTLSKVTIAIMKPLVHEAWTLMAAKAGRSRGRRS